MSDSGPDVAPIQCYVPDGCCGPSPCDITQDQFICQVRALLPEGDIYNTTLPTSPPESDINAIGAITVGCSRVGCEQLVFGQCCEQIAIPCDSAIVAPQVALIDAFSAAAFGSMQALCRMLRELDPCTADLTLQRWAQRFGLINDACGPQWSDATLKVLLCEMQQIKQHIINWDFLQTLAARFGATITQHAAGDMNCGPSGWWSMARDQPICAQPAFCPDTIQPNPAAFAWLRLTPTCVGPPESLNLVLSPADITFPDNCNMPVEPLPHDPELFQALLWLLPKILPPTVYWCVYASDPPNCII